jgi:murein DD-endopeptidase MepM/ murein hydrolase activator NlpD
MKRSAFLLPLAVVCFQQAAAQLDNATIRDLKGGRVINDTSYIYWLPYEMGKKFFLIQGWESSYSHKGELSLDFKMKTGTRIMAAREGIVKEVKEDSDKGGTKEEYLSEGNHIVIQHSDGTCSGYWHLQKDGSFVQQGDTVTKGQCIGLSGNTGYSAFPHLHFWVYKNDGGFKTLPTRFHTKSGPRYLRPGHFYQSVHQQK